MKLFLPADNIILIELEIDFDFEYESIIQHVNEIRKLSLPFPKSGRQ